MKHVRPMTVRRPATAQQLPVFLSVIGILNSFFSLLIVVSDLLSLGPSQKKDGSM